MDHILDLHDKVGVLDMSKDTPWSVRWRLAPENLPD
jgi:hypothetical protein